MTTLGNESAVSERDGLLDRIHSLLVEGARLSGIEHVQTSEPRQASFAQRRLWFLDRLELDRSSGGNVAYNLPVTMRLRGPLEPAVLQESLDEVMRRHEVLRTRFVDVGGEPFQVVMPAGRWPLVCEDLSECAAEDREQRVAAGLSRSAWAPFDLASGPLVRGVLFRLSTREHVLGLTIHHVVADGWSIGVLMQDLSLLYEALAGGRPSPLAPLPIQYADFAEWQSRSLAAASDGDDLSYWRSRLAGAPPVLDLPADLPAPARSSPAGGISTTGLPQETAAALRELAASEDATPFMLVTAAIALLLGRYGATDDVVVGAPVAGRTRPETASLVGLFLNTLPLRVELSRAGTFRELLRLVRSTTLDAQAHQDLPFERLVEALQPDRTLTHSPIFQVLVNHTSTLPLTTTLGPLDVEYLEPAEVNAKFPLSFYVSEQDTFSFSLVYQSELFSPRRIDTILRTLVHLVGQVVADAERPLAGYRLLEPAQLPVVADLGQPLEPEPYPSVPELVGRIVHETPHAPALRWREGTVTYRELQQHVDGLRRVLRRRGVSRSDRVAVTGQRSPGLVAAILAVLAEGAVLVLLDPELPRHRLAAMMRSSAASTVLFVGDPHQEPPLPVQPEQLVRVGAAGRLTSEVEDTGEPGEALPWPEVTALDPAYVFFTSGTTGRPKGVLGRHTGLSHFLCWQRDTFAIAPGDTCAQLTALSFDVVMRDILLPLVSGATLLLADEGLSPDRVLPWLADAGASVAHVVPTLAGAWLAASSTDRPVPLRHTFFAGEPLTSEVVSSWRQRCPATGVVNLYGPTETTLAKCWYRVPAEPAAGVQPVGTPLPSTQVAVLRPDGGACGVAEPGEVVIRTPYRSLGYLDPEPGDAARFFVNPHTGDPDDILFRTGDRGRLREDGTLELLGRLDRQLKIRGVRVEPDEVATVLSGHPAVMQAVVAGTSGDDGAPALAAYVVAPRDGSVSEAQLRSYLTKRLPTAMVPGVIVFLEAIPVGANGKVDWRSLPQLALDGEAAVAHEPPRTPTERRLADIWAELFHRPNVGRLDDFFRMGGHSLMAMQLASRVNDAFAITFPLVGIFQNPTLADLAQAVDLTVAEGGSAKPALPRIARAERTPATSDAGSIGSMGARR